MHHLPNRGPVVGPPRQSGRASCPSFLRPVALLLASACGLLVGSLAHRPPAASEPPGDPAARELHRRAERANDLDWLADAAGRPGWLGTATRRDEVIAEKHLRLGEGDEVAAARASAILSAEARLRAVSVLDRWAQRIDPETGLLPKGVEASDNLWDYADAGADLYPHLVIAATQLRPTGLPRLARVIEAERTIAGPGSLPRNVDLAADRPDGRPRDVMYGSVEYAKDGLLPLAERLGPGPWTERLEEIADLAIASSPVHTRFGAIPSEESEVNGQALQVLARVFWITGDRAYLDAARRISRAYLELALPATDWVPTRTWDFRRERTTTSVVQLRDHGNEVIAGLVELHLIESALGLPSAAENRPRIRAMLDRLLERGRDSVGLWESTIDLETGQPLKQTRSDNWGYLYAAYLTQAIVEETWPGGDAERAGAYRAASATGLAAAARLDNYPWQGTEQDGYADTIESALYLLRRQPSATAATWVDDQAGTLFGAQAADGTVEDSYLDGNFVRTALLYAAWQSQGASFEPWDPRVALGAAPDGRCVALVAAAGGDWEGVVRFDAPRHRLHMRLPLDYPRLNEWSEWFVAEPGREYVVEHSAHARTEAHDGASLNRGLALRLGAGDEWRARVCPAGG